MPKNPKNTNLLKDTEMVTQHFSEITTEKTYVADLFAT